MRDQDAWLCFEDEAGQSLRPPKARTWSRRGTTPAVRVSGKGSDRVSLAGLVCTQGGFKFRIRAVGDRLGCTAGQARAS